MKNFLRQMEGTVLLAEAETQTWARITKARGIVAK
jgi:hypothetical protein